jgi:hypothetical protein
MIGQSQKRELKFCRCQMVLSSGNFLFVADIQSAIELCREVKEFSSQ